MPKLSSALTGSLLATVLPLVVVTGCGDGGSHGGAGAGARAGAGAGGTNSGGARSSGGAAGAAGSATPGRGGRGGATGGGGDAGEDQGAGAGGEASGVGGSAGRGGKGGNGGNGAVGSGGTGGDAGDAGETGEAGNETGGSGGTGGSAGNSAGGAGSNAGGAGNSAGGAGNSAGGSSGQGAAGSDAGGTSGGGTAGSDAGTGGVAGSGGAPVSKEWRGAELLELDDTNPAGAPAVAFGDGNSATALWWQEFSDTGRIGSARFDDGGPWGAAAPIDESGDGAYGEPDLAFDPSGDGIAVWIEYRGVVPSVRASRVVAGSWSPALFIDTVDSGSARSPKVAVNASGDAVAVWTKDGDAGPGIRHDVWAARYTAGVGWGIAVPIENNDAGGVQDPEVAIDSAGNVIAVWSQYDDNSVKNVWFNRFRGGVWETATFLEDEDTNADTPEIAMNTNGDAIVVWASTYIWARGYSAGTGTWIWSQTVSGAGAGSPQIAFDQSGHALVVWSEGMNGDPNNIWANRYTTGTGWAGPVPVHVDAVNSGTEPDLAVNGDGDAIVAWLQYDGVRNSVCASRYTAGQSWGAATSLESSNSRAMSVRAALDAGGDAVVVWEQSSNGRDSLWSNRYR